MVAVYRRGRRDGLSQQISELSASEQQWVDGNVELAREIAKTAGLEVERVLDPQTLDIAWAGWLAGHARGEEDPNPYINAFGLALGAYLVDRLGLEWKVVQDEHGTEIAVWGREGNILVFPPNLVGKRYVAETTTFFADVAAKTEEQVSNVRAEACDKKRSGISRFLRKDR